MRDVSLRRNPCLVRIEYRYQRDLRQVQPFTQKVDADKDIELRKAQISDDLKSLEVVYLRVEISDPDTLLLQEFGQVLCHPFGESCDQNSLVLISSCLYLTDEIVDLSLGRTDLDLRIEKTCRPDQLLGSDSA